MKKPFFYEVKNEQSLIHILGTVHFGVPADDLPDFVMEKFDQTNYFSFEVDPTDSKTMDELEKQDMVEDAEQIKVELSKSPALPQKTSAEKLNPRLSDQAWKTLVLNAGSPFYQRGSIIAKAASLTILT